MVEAQTRRRPLWSRVGVRPDSSRRTAACRCQRGDASRDGRENVIIFMARRAEGGRVCDWNGHSGARRREGDHVDVAVGAGTKSLDIIDIERTGWIRGDKVVPRHQFRLAGRIGAAQRLRDAIQQRNAVADGHVRSIE